ncbi:M23 family metallopeptidase [Streptomyces sp. NBC_01476]|uniref:M23 family metallopeptidase n=1 Tax=Streptomyces sp. NBC_01476 TaxID=2903881 RepID=UPI002E352C89|nr:M23 family metallopeptidase [Streptomyces sp. NBC_01476]
MTFTTTMLLTLLTAALLTTAPALGGALPAPAPARGCTAERCWPVPGPGVRGRPVILRAFEPPPTPWAAGHRGVDLWAAPGTPVRAAAAGEVIFTGEVGGIPVVVIGLPGGLRTTYEPVRATVPRGTRVTAGQQVGLLASGLPHCPGPCLHWGLLRGEVYLDPLTLLPPALRRSGPSRLLPPPEYGPLTRRPAPGGRPGRLRAGPW